jgi:hypothetical protein
MPYAEIKSENSEYLTKDSKSIQLIESKKMQEQAAFDQKIQFNKNRREKIRYDYLRRTQMREQLEGAIGTPHSKFAPGDSIITSGFEVSPEDIRESPFHVARGNWNMQKELKQVNAVVC